MTKFSTCKKRGTQFLEGNNYLDAVKNFDKAIDLDPEYSDSWYFRGRSKYFLNQYEEAIKDFDKAIEL